MSAKSKKNISYVLFVAPAVLLFAVFIVWPFFLGIGYSLMDWDGISSHMNFIGLSNYVNVLQDSKFLSALIFTVKYTVLTVILLNGLALALAVALNMGLKLQGILRAVYFVPMVIGSVTVGYLWNFIINKFFPVLGNLFGIELLTKNWFTYPQTAFAALVIVTVWQSVGYYMIIYIAGLQSVPGEILEAAAIDGASPASRFFRVVLPLIRPSVTICLFLSIVNGLKAFDLNYSLTSGGPFGTTQSLSFQIYVDAFNKDMLSFASAKAVVFCIIVAIIAFTQVKLTNRKEVEM